MCYEPYTSHSTFFIFTRGRMGHPKILPKRDHSVSNSAFTCYVTFSSQNVTFSRFWVTLSGFQIVVFIISKNVLIFPKLGHEPIVFCKIARAWGTKTLILQTWTCPYVSLCSSTGDWCWDLFLGPLEWARAETGGAYDLPITET